MEVLCAAVVALFPSSGSDQILFTALVGFVYLLLTGYYKPFPTKELNYLDGIASSCTLLQIVHLQLSAHFGLAMQLMWIGHLCADSHAQAPGILAFCILQIRSVKVLSHRCRSGWPATPLR